MRSPNLCFCIPAAMERRDKSNNSMLHQFTWQQFLLAAFVLSLVWYLAIFLLYYRNKAADLFSGKTKSKQPEKLRREWDEELEDDAETDEAGDDGLMGKASEPEGVSTVPMDGFRFAERPADKDARRDEQLGLVPDVLEELKGIFNILAKEDGNKADFVSLFRLVSSKYPKIRNTPNQQAINDYIRENLPFDISDEDLDNLWQ